ncbi:MAG: UvrB/UvrC motif-containing protein, partial [Bacteroidales bacterium]|nr:UvrB/UvrC motif-containing protein [Bacteroidales bacterium]
IGQRLFVSATPGDYELEECKGVIVEQVVRPTGLLDPPIEIRPTKNQVDDLLEEIQIRADHNERVLVTTLTKRMAEELEKYLTRMDVRCRYIHSDVETLERVEIIEDFKAGSFDVLVGVNLLREGLDIPGVSLVAILDADKEGFLRSERSLTQTAGRAARNVNGKVIMYADTITRSMELTINETNRRREKQQAYNKEHGITPHQVGTRANNILYNKSAEEAETSMRDARYLQEDPVISKMSGKELDKAISAAKKKMESAAAELDFLSAAKFRDEMNAYKKLKEKGL